MDRYLKPNHHATYNLVLEPFSTFFHKIRFASAKQVSTLLSSGYEIGLLTNLLSPLCEYSPGLHSVSVLGSFLSSLFPIVLNVSKCLHDVDAD